MDNCPRARFCRRKEEIIKVGKNRDTVSVEPGSLPNLVSTLVSKDTFASVACVECIVSITEVSPIKCVVRESVIATTHS